METYNPEKTKQRTYLPELKAIIERNEFLLLGQKELAEMGDKKDTLRHSQRMTNLGYLLAKRQNFSEGEIKFFVEACLLHDIGKIEVPLRYLTRPTKKFSPKDMQVIKKHPRRGYEILKHSKRSPRVYYPVLLHHQFQEKPYPETNARTLKNLSDVEDVDVDNARLLAMVDVFDRCAFGAKNIEPLPLDQIKPALMKQFNQKSDEEIIDFLISHRETIKNLNQG